MHMADSTNTDSKVYLVYLIDVGRNYAIYATDALWEESQRSDARGGEFRKPHLLSVGEVDSFLNTLDLGCRLIESWEWFYTWLGRGHGWATFTQESAAEFVPHWLGPNVVIECARQIDENGIGHPPLLDLSLHQALENIPQDSAVTLPRLDALEGFVGSSPETLGRTMAMQLGDNMVVTCQPIFV